MFEKLRNNPILAHQMRHARWPSVRTAVLLAAVLTVVGLALTIAGYAISPDGEKGWVLIVPSLIWLNESLLLVFGPLLTAIVAVVTTVRAIGSENYQMMRLSQLSDHDIVNGYLSGAVFRLRSLWMIAGGLALPMVTALTHIGVLITILFTCGPNRNLMQQNTPCTPPAPSDIIMEQAGTALITTGCYVTLFITWNWLAANLGVRMAFRHRRTGRALVAALLPLIFVIALTITMIFVISDWQWVTIIVSVVINLALGWRAYRRAVKHVNSTGERPMI